MGERLRSRHIQLKLLDPLRTLDRGFALLTDERGVIIRHAATLSADQRIDIRLSDGSVPATITGPARPPLP